MAENSSTQAAVRDRSSLLVGPEDRLSKWLFFSFLVHSALIVALFVVPFFPSSSRPEFPVYTVDLVGGEKIGGRNFGTEMVPPPAPKGTTKSAPEAAPPVMENKEAPKPEPKAEKPKPVEKTKPVEKQAPTQEKLALNEQKKEATKAEPTKKEPAKETKSESRREDAALDRVRESLIQSAVDRVKSRTETAQKANKGEAISSGTGEGEGAAALGPGGRGGGVVKGMEFIIYQNRMFSSIKENWAWVGPRSNLKVVVHFGIKDNGEITGLKIVQPSGDPSYDESVLRAVKKSSPLPPPPEEFRKDFSNVEIAFRPKDLGA
jgi:colicin import membrane protein